MHSEQGTGDAQARSLRARAVGPRAIASPCQQVTRLAAPYPTPDWTSLPNHVFWPRRVFATRTRNQPPSGAEERCPHQTGCRRHASTLSPTTGARPSKDRWQKPSPGPSSGRPFIEPPRFWARKGPIMGNGRGRTWRCWYPKVAGCDPRNS